jgi:hypothetical protein
MMATKQRAERGEENEPRANQQRIAAIVTHILSVLGQPLDLHEVQVRLLWDDHYRVNVLVGADASSIKVAHSYFLVVDEGRIVASSPNLTGQY